MIMFQPRGVVAKLVTAFYFYIMLFIVDYCACHELLFYFIVDNYLIF